MIPPSRVRSARSVGPCGQRTARACYILLAALLFQFASAAIAESLAQAPAAAPSGRAGLWLTSGVGTGVRWVGRGANLRIGGALSRSILLGAELLHYGERGEDGLLDVHDNLSAVAVYRLGNWPWRPYVKVGVGLARYAEQVSLDGWLINIASEGLGYTLGAGFDIPLFWQIAVTPCFDLLHSIGVRGDPRPVLLFSLGLTIL
jgi:hypothetical protein